MKKTILKLLIQVGIILVIYFMLLNALAGTNIVAGIFCPGPHLPAYYPILIGLFILFRFWVLLLPGIVLSRLLLSRLQKR